MMMPKNQPTLFDSLPPVMPKDVCISRHRGAATSIEANPSDESKTATQRTILGYLGFIGTATSKEIAAELGKPLNALSGRCSELLALGLIERVPGERRDGCAVLRLRRTK